MLSLLIWGAVVGAGLIAVLPTADQKQCRTWALAIASGLLAFSGWICTQGSLVESLPWLPSLGLSYELAIDGLSLPLVLLNSLLVWVAIFASDQVERPRFYYPLILLLSAGIYGTFLAQNLLLFLLFYEAELIPLYLLIGIWGGKNRSYAATKFLIYTAVSGFVLLGVFLAIAAVVSNQLDLPFSFDLRDLATQQLPLQLQIILLLGIIFGFAIKIPLVPFHTWLPDAHVEASTPVSVLLAGVLLKLGTYGLLRFGLDLFPQAWQAIAPGLAVWAAVSVIYGCSVAIIQTDMKKMVAYSSIGHMGYILLALAAATPLSTLGAVLQMICHGLISGLLFLLVGIIYQKTGTRDLNRLQGLLNPERGLPVTGALMILAAMASAGIPGMAGFVAEFIIFRGSFGVFPYQTIFCMLGTVLTAVYFLILIDRAFFGRFMVLVASIDQPDQLMPLSQSLPQSNLRDLAPPLVLVVLIIGFGLQPQWLLQLVQLSSDHLISKIL
ncbi:MAG: NADH-quinone oxidoreductase subunit M [Pseudanabaenaceae cyanobacterium bins.68]|nr:NADH-quinone oxidoreductase subunit M [Pseudanabaenaceae cyanobacterium bins.68]